MEAHYITQSPHGPARHWIEVDSELLKQLGQLSSRDYQGRYTPNQPILLFDQAKNMQANAATVESLDQLIDSFERRKAA